MIEPDRARHTPRDPRRLAALTAIGLTPRLLQLCDDDADREPLRVTEVQRETLALHDGVHEHVARPLPALVRTLAAADDALAVGDWVLAARDVHGDWWAHERLPPSTQLARRLHDGRDKVTRTVIVSNVDTALLVMGLDHDWSPRRLERYLALVRLAGIRAVVVLTKADLCHDAAARIDAVRALTPADVDVVALDATGASGTDPRAVLAPWLAAGSTLVLLGSSGVGKSTLTNALLGACVQATGGTRHGDGRGRHTTTSRSLHIAPGGACIVDTPGLRTLRLDGEAGDVAGAFDDIAALAVQCRFRDCSHAGEPGCAVRAGVAPERIASFAKLMREARRDTMSALERKQLVSQWKQRGRAARVNVRAKRGDS